MAKRLRNRRWKGDGSELELPKPSGPLGESPKEVTGGRRDGCFGRLAEDRCAEGLEGGAGG